MFLICMSCGFFAESDIVLNRSVSEPKSALALVSPMSPYQDEKPVEVSPETGTGFQNMEDKVDTSKGSKPLPIPEVSPKEERQDFDQASSVKPLVSKDQEHALCSTGLAAVALSSLGLIVVGRTARSPSL
jgi:hypothetical protein